MNSLLTNLGSSIIKQGGALLLVNSNMTSQNLQFINNTAVEGGAVYYSCLGINLCVLDISDSSFINNIAMSSGGAIRYDVYSPILYNEIFEGITALYGPNIASYPVKIKIVDSTTDSIKFRNIGSGIASDAVFISRSI